MKSMRVKTVYKKVNTVINTEKNNKKFTYGENMFHEEAKQKNVNRENHTNKDFMKRK